MRPSGLLHHHTVGGLAMVSLVALAAASCTSRVDQESLGVTAAALTAEDAVRAACKGTYKNHGQCVACVAHASGDGALVSEFARGECHDKCIRTSCAVEGKTCGTVADGCGGTLTCGAPCGQRPLFLPSENHRAYTLREVCSASTSNGVGAIPPCCRQDRFTTDTTCTTTLHEEVDATGKLIVRIDPLLGCITTGSDLSCTRSGTLDRCDASNLTCPAAAPLGSPGDPSSLAGTYVRTALGPDGLLVFDEYRGSCGTAAGYLVSVPTCVPPSVLPDNVAHMATFTKSGPGHFAIRRTFGPGGGFSVAAWCGSPITPPLRTLPSTVSVTGFARGGTFELDGHDCTYELTQSP